MRLIGVVTILALCTPAVAGPGTPPPARAPTPADPLDRPWFTASPAELLAAARAATATDHDVVVLREDVIVSYDERGRADERRRVIFAVLTPKGADDWGPISLGWAPFYQDKPTVRARVIAPDGTVAELDPSLVHDAPTVRESPVVYSDRRDLQAPLPRLSVGAVVEEVFTFRDREPLLAAGSVDWHAIRRGVPIGRKRITIASPKARPVTVVVRGPGAVGKPRTTVEGARTVVTFDLTDVAPADDDVVGAPSDHLVDDWIGISTGKSWAAVADDYRALVERQLAAGATLPAEVRGPTPRATVDRALAWLHARVRYTGIELSDSAIIPATPADTLARGFGDCKDKATLLVSLLRSAGITADVALLATGPGWDVDPALPGMGSFDHAIVRAVVDGKPVWIDATEDLLPAGQLPTRDQDRRVLIIAAGTKGLAPTPTASAADSLVREVRTYRLAEEGSSKVVEVNEPAGIYAAGMRDRVLTASRADLEEDYGNYVDRAYRGRLARMSHSDARDLAAPFTLTFEVDATGRVNAARDQLSVWLFPAHTLGQLPGLLADRDDEVEREVRGRTVDYVWASPHVYEIVNRLELPPGYQTPEAPARETRAVGAMTLTTTRARAGDVYTITYRLDTGKRRLTADELRATRTAILALSDENAEHVVLELTAARLRRDGKLREAIAEDQRLIALHPKEALHHGHLAQTYLTTGMVEAARREARQATTLEPGSGDAWMVLGHVLEHDPFNRRFAPGSDRAGAELAYRKALALPPAHVGARDNLIELLTTDATGRPSRERARLTEAIALLRAPEAEDLDDHELRLTRLMIRAEDAKGLAALAATPTDSPARRLARLGATALADGGEAALRKAGAIGDADQRAAALNTLSVELSTARRHDLARPIQRENMRGRGPGPLGVIERLRTVDLSTLPPTDPRTPVILAIARLTFGKVPTQPWGAEVEADLVHEAKLLQSEVQLPTSIAVDAILDYVVAGLELEVSGDRATGWRVVVRTNGMAAPYYVELRKGRAWLVGSGEFGGGIGREVMGALARRDLATARTRLTRLADDSAASRFPFLHRHRAALSSAPAPLLSLVAASLLARAAPAEAAPILARCADLTERADQASCHRAAAFAFVDAGELPRAASELQAVIALEPDEPPVLVALARVLHALGRDAEAIPPLDAALARKPDQFLLALSRAQLELRGGWAAARPRFEALVQGPRIDASAINWVAWVYLYFEPTAATSRALIERKAIDLAPNERNTLAAALAESNEPYLAWQQVAAYLAPAAELDPADWYVLGRIAEGYGLRDDAVAAYRKVTAPRLPGLPPSAHDLAARRLRALGVAP